MKEESKSIEELEREIFDLNLKLQQVEERRQNEIFWFQNIVDSIPNPLFIKNEKHAFHTTNLAFEEFVDVTKEELYQKTDWDFFPKEEANVFIRMDNEVLENGETNWNEEKITINGETRELLTSKVRVKDKEGNKFILGIITDLTDKENQHIELLHKKDQLELEKNNVQVLLKEIHHRVKNNMQVISSLLSLQKEKFGNKEVQKAFADCKDRITAMSSVHEILYKTENLSNINFSTYIETLTRKLKESYGLGNEIEFYLDIIHLFLNVNIAVPLGLAINEIVINSIKHGKIEGKTLKIYIRLITNQGKCILTIGDNGKGKDEESQSDKDTFGVELIDLFCRQINASIDLVEDSEGTHYQITFENKRTKKR